MTSLTAQPPLPDLLSKPSTAPYQTAGSGSHGRKMQRLTLAGFVCSFIVMAAISVLAFHQARIFKRAANGLAQSQEILRNLEQLRTEIASAETNHRGYLITGEAAYLAPYEQMLAKIRPDLEHLTQLVAGDPQQFAQAIELKLNIGARIQTFKQVIAAYQTRGFKAAQDLVAQDIGRKQTAQAYRSLDDMSALTQERLQANQQQQQAAEARLRYSIAALAVVLLTVLSLIYVLVSRSVAAARHAEHLLNTLNATLETRVIERTNLLEERSRELEERSAQLESFSYSVSHDLRAPLRAVNGFAQILARRHRDSMDDDAKHFVDNIVQASTHMGRLIDDLLNYSRLGRKAIVLKPVALAQVLDNIRNTLQPRVTETGATLQIPADLPMVTGDWTLLTQTFTNLIDNALTYRKSDVPLQVSLQWRNSDDGHVVISVADNGIGIASEHFEKIFSVFQRLHNQDEYPGTGIGLSVVQKATGMQDGKVWLESTVGSGSTFYVQLPAAPAISS